MGPPRNREGAMSTDDPSEALAQTRRSVRSFWLQLAAPAVLALLAFAVFAWFAADLLDPMWSRSSPGLRLALTLAGLVAGVLTLVARFTYLAPARLAQAATGQLFLSYM